MHQPDGLAYALYARFASRRVFEHIATFPAYPDSAAIEFQVARYADARVRVRRKRMQVSVVVRANCAEHVWPEALTAWHASEGRTVAAFSIRGLSGLGANLPRLALRLPPNPPAP